MDGVAAEHRVVAADIDREHVIGDGSGRSRDAEIAEFRTAAVGEVAKARIAVVAIESTSPSVDSRQCRSGSLPTESS